MRTSVSAEGRNEQSWKFYFSLWKISQKRRFRCQSNLEIRRAKRKNPDETYALFHVYRSR